MLTGLRRSSLEVIGDILRNTGSKTKIMYGAGLSYEQTQKYLALLSDHQLIGLTKGPEGRPKYVRTERGEKFLALLETIENLVNEPAPSRNAR